MDRYNTSPAEIIDHVYRQPKPNTYLSSFAPFIAEHLGTREVYQLVKDAFRSFITQNVKQYPIHATNAVHFVGSIATYFRIPLESACQKEGITLGRIIKEPMEGLIEYHRD